MQNNPEERLQEILVKHPEFPLAAYHAIHKGLDHTIKMKGAVGHVSGQELALGMAAYLRDDFGPFARIVLDGWGVSSTADIGKLVYNLIEGRLMRKQEADAITDFANVYDFEDVFGGGYDWLEEIRSEHGLQPNKTQKPIV